MIWNSIPVLPHFDDPGFPVLTLILSIEASLAASIIIMANQSAEVMQKKQLEYIAHMLEAMIEMLEKK